MKILGLLGSLLAWFCVGTVLAQGVLLLVVWSKGYLTGDRVTAALAALYGVADARGGADGKQDGPPEEQVSYEAVLQRRALAALDMEMREEAIDKSLGDLRNLESQIKTERERLDLWKLSFDQRLAALGATKADEALQETQRTLEAMSAKQAKDQILKILQRPADAQDRPMQDVVAIFRAMPLDKRKKIFVEFKTAEETDKLSEILREIRLGAPDLDLIRDSRSQLQQQLGPKR